ncbi:MAG: hypothetical protein ACFB0E_20140 [Leptolyngbyaceae cyanobacterium]
MFSSRRYRAVSMLLLTLILLGALAVGRPSQAQTPNDENFIFDRVNSYLSEAQIATGAADLAIALAADPSNDELRFGTGILQFANAIENLGQAWYDYGLLSDGPLSGLIPFLRLPVPRNPVPATISHGQSRQALNQFVEDILQAERTLALINDDAVSLDIYLGRAYVDFDSNGRGSPPESLWRIYAALNRGAQLTAAQTETFFIRFDAGDVLWLRGYCHFLAAVLDFYLAHDDAQLFNHGAHLFFQRAETPYTFLTAPSLSRGWVDSVFLDAIALVHLINLPVIDRPRAVTALNHLQQMTDLSRQSWQLYSQETDDIREWIPYPGQTGVIPGAAVSREMIDEWFAFLDEADKILAGDRLLPFWRGDDPVGLNLKRVFTEPQAFDAVRWVQGTAAAPYLESGEITDPDFWQQLMTSFNGQFLFFAFWFN